MLESTLRWLRFEQAIQSCILRHSEVPITNPIQNCLNMETQIRTLCLEHFPPVHSITHTNDQLRSMTARMWHARTQFRYIFIVTVKSLFNNWKYCTIFHKLHAQTRRFSRINKRRKLEKLLQENIAHVVTNRIHEWYRSIRKLCPKQPFRRIQMHDHYGAPIIPRQELDSLIAHFGQLFIDVDFDLTPQPLSCLPFTQDDLACDLSRLPSTKALAPDGFPAVVWQYFAHTLASIVYQAAAHAWVDFDGTPLAHWSMD